MPEEMNTQNIEAPESQEDEELREAIIMRYQKVKKFYTGWEEEAREDFDFALGKQWTDKDKKKLESEKRPALTFNRIKPLINLIAGYQRQNSARIKVSPEGGEDQVFSEVLDKAIQAINKWSKLEYKMSYQFDDGLYVGKGFIEAIMDYSKDPISGEMKFLILTPYEVLIDPHCKEYDLNEGAEYVFKVKKYTRSRLKEMFPDKKSKLDDFQQDSDEVPYAPVTKEGGADNYGAEPNVDTQVTETEGPDTEIRYKKDVTFTLKEYWYKKYVKRWFVVNAETGSPERFDEKELAEEYAKEQDRKVFERSVPEMWVASMVAGHILRDIKSTLEPEYSGYPFFRFIADWAPSASSETLRVQGVTRSLKDPQREKNKAKSQYLHILNTQPHSGWVGAESALSKEGWKQLEKMGSTPGITVKTRDEHYEKLREIRSKNPNMGHLQREQAADEEFKQISNINPDLLGFQEKTSSGRAIALRIRQAVLALVRIFTNYRYTKEIIGKFILEMLPELFDEKKLAHVLGQDYMKSVNSKKYPNGITEGTLKAFLRMIKDHKYDVEVTEADNVSTTRYEIFEQLTELAKAGFPIPMDLILEYMQIQNKDQIMDKIKQQQQTQAQQEKK